MVRGVDAGEVDVEARGRSAEQWGTTMEMGSRDLSRDRISMVRRRKRGGKLRDEAGRGAAIGDLLGFRGSCRVREYLQEQARGSGDAGKAERVGRA